MRERIVWWPFRRKPAWMRREPDITITVALDGELKWEIHAPAPVIVNTHQAGSMDRILGGGDRYEIEVRSGAFQAGLDAAAIKRREGK